MATSAPSSCGARAGSRTIMRIGTPRSDSCAAMRPPTSPVAPQTAITRTRLSRRTRRARSPAGPLDHVLVERVLLVLVDVVLGDNGGRHDHLARDLGRHELAEALTLRDQAPHVHGGGRHVRVVEERRPVEAALLDLLHRIL